MGKNSYTKNSYKDQLEGADKLAESESNAQAGGTSTKDSKNSRGATYPHASEPGTPAETTPKGKTKGEDTDKDEDKDPEADASEGNENPAPKTPGMSY